MAINIASWPRITEEDAARMYGIMITDIASTIARHSVSCLRCSEDVCS
jgi:hypothetical protein